LLTKFRGAAKPVLHKLGAYLARKGIKPNYVTVTGLLISLCVPISAYLQGPTLLIPILIVVSSILDLVDGAIAKAASLRSSFGSFLDSVCDRVSDACYLLALGILGLNNTLIIITLSASFLISYMRAKAESLGLKMEGVGLMERGDRVVITLVISTLTVTGFKVYANYLLIISLLLCLVTVLQRGIHVWHKLRK